LAGALEKLMKFIDLQVEAAGGVSNLLLMAGEDRKPNYVIAAMLYSTLLIALLSVVFMCQAGFGNGKIKKQ